MRLPAILGRGDVTVAVDLDPVGEPGNAALEVLHERLLEAGSAVQRGQIGERRAQAFPRALRRLGHRHAQISAIVAPNTRAHATICSIEVQRSERPSS